MPRIVCPTCGITLEISDEMFGQQIECGGCKEVFTALTSQSLASEAEERPSRRRSSNKAAADDHPRRPSRSRRSDDDEDEERPSRRKQSRFNDDEDEDDYDDLDYRQYRRGDSEPQTGYGITSMVTGICSLCMSCCCWGVPTFILAIVAIVFGIMSLKTEGRNMGIAGLITAVIGVLLSLGFIVAGVAFNILALAK